MDEIDWAVSRPSVVPPGECARCARDPATHSAYERGYATDEGVVIYTAPSDSVLATGYTTHFLNLVKAARPYPWVWALDARGLRPRHVPLVASLLRVACRHGARSIHVLHASLVVRAAVLVASPFLPRVRLRR